MMSSPFRQILDQERTRLRRVAVELFEAFAARKPEAYPAELLAAAVKLRQSVTVVLRQYASRLNNNELIELQSSLHLALDRQIEAAIKKSFERRIKTLTDQAQRDPLTMLPNRATFARRLDDEVSLAWRYHGELSLVLFDIDDFKLVNDKFGHPAGDQVLIAVADVLQTSLRRNDAVFRYGGDEFIALCPETSGFAMETILQRVEINLRISCADIVPSHSPGISWGFASFPTDADNADDLIRLADQRLYFRKKEHHQRLAEHS